MPSTIAYLKNIINYHLVWMDVHLCKKHACDPHPHPTSPNHPGDIGAPAP